ncbi:hypothetical protein X747_16695 [Mesorhizobium sp. LNJC384A00]|nr:hypothetical protein X764_19205 [Mesorhizobium sp. LSHC440A00]ESX88017.1 hypothetical protein X756_13205 [Mesorhizobium sp. LSHC412B00]ESY02058.1 hypothetical protein X753_26890 [Mesorhizobium sp. LNJC399B00]ESY41409.1 hypothetical protein X747_16695 [Mesorhizobium sp. LNJC384A00]ESZ14279.1 hypothetical protein X735_18135 [Mesorhizobium sp. L2C085B000]ESZ71154.1 hypothetical protein X726_29380 [Mesorhizobium sp. L103C105A0]
MSALARPLQLDSRSVDGITGHVDENNLAMSFTEFRSRYSL